MIRNLKPYPEYRDSGVPWLGEVPEHWDSAAVRRYCRVFAGATPSRAVPEYWANGSIPWLSSGEVNLRRITKAKQFITEAGYAASSTKWIRPRSLVLALAGQGRTKGMVATVECRTTCNQSLAAIEPSPSSADHRFLAYYLESRYLDLRALVGDGLRDGLNLEHVQSIPTPLPPLKEQSAIVHFLDHADRRIRRYIRAKQQLIALLHEQRQAIIHRAVTRGLAHDVRLKPSGVEWLGDVPEDWEVRKLKHVTSFLNGCAFKPADWRSEGVPIIRIQNLNGSTVFNYTTRKDLPKQLLIQPGALLFAWSGNRGTSFGSFQWDRSFPAYLNQHIFRLHGYELPARYFYYVLRAVTQHVEDQADGIIGLVHITRPELGAVEVPLAPYEEQVRIARYLDNETRRHNTAITSHKQTIALLREYRTRLIADVVTGKLDVREAATRLPVEAEEPELFDDAGALAKDSGEETEATDPDALEEAEA